MDMNNINSEGFTDLDVISNQCIIAVKELLTVAKLKEKSIVVVGCSTSEVDNQRIGTSSNPDLGKCIFQAVNEELKSNGLYMAAQCCEHLNRAIVMEREAAQAYGYEEVNVVPKPKAGGSFATAAYEGMKDPVVVEEVKASAGIDIGNTLIGMHLKKVAVPVRIETNTIGHANVVCARTRPKYIGGERAHYNEELA